MIRQSTSNQRPNDASDTPRSTNEARVLSPPYVAKMSFDMHTLDLREASLLTPEGGRYPIRQWTRAA